MIRNEHLGTLSIMRLTSGDGENTMRLELKDGASGAPVVRVELDLEGLMMALTGRSDVPCTFGVETRQVGRVRETKEERVPCTGLPDWTAAGAAAVGRERLAPFEVDGWKGHLDDLFSSKRQDQGFARVTFVRFVDIWYNMYMEKHIEQRLERLSETGLAALLNFSDAELSGLFVADGERVREQAQRRLDDVNREERRG